MRDQRSFNRKTLPSSPARKLPACERDVNLGPTAFRRAGWLVGLLTFLAALATGVEVTSGDKFDFLFTTTGSEPIEISQTIEDHRYVQVAELVTFRVNQLEHRSLDARTVVDAAYVTDDGPANGKTDANAGSKPQPVSSKRMALSPEARSELEFWRVVVRSDDPALYKSYLRHYPDGTFVPLARSSALLQPKADRTPERPKPKPEIRKNAESPDGRCESDNSRCSTAVAAAAAAEQNCTPAEGTTVCIRRNYRALDRSTPDAASQRYRY
jgi:hypothetical protein